MKNKILSVASVSILLTSCAKNKCAECHFDGPTGEVEMGVFCGDSLRNLEEVGTHTDTLGNVYVVHCGEH